MSYARSTELVVGTTVYEIRHADTSTGLACGARLANMAAPLITGARRGASVAAALEYAMAQPDLGANLQFLGKAFAAFTTIRVAEGAPPLKLADTYEEWFAGRYDHFVAWLKAAVEFDLSSFLAGLSTAGAALEAALPKDKSASTAPNSPAKTG